MNSGTPDDGIPQKYRLSQGFIEIMPPEEQTLTDASVVVNENGQTVMKFTKLLVEPNQIPITAGENNMLWAHGGDGRTSVGFHGQYRESLSLLKLTLQVGQLRQSVLQTWPHGLLMVFAHSLPGECLPQLRSIQQSIVPCSMALSGSNYINFSTLPPMLSQLSHSLLRLLL